MKKDNEKKSMNKWPSMLPMLSQLTILIGIHPRTSQEESVFQFPLAEGEMHGS